MCLDDMCAVVDNDFLQHMAETRLTDEALVSALKTILSDLELTAVIHPLVLEKEVLKDKPRIRLLLEKAVVSAAAFDDIFLGDPGDLERRAYYLYLVKELYRHLQGEPLPVDGEDIFTYWIRGRSLGEVHSVSMCLVCGSGIFLSDDGDAKALESYVRRAALGSISVYRREELIDRHLQSGAAKLSRHTRRALTHGKEQGT